MAKKKRQNRTADMDEALFEALKSTVPPKDTGPDPDDVLASLFDEDEDEGEGEMDAAFADRDGLTVAFTRQERDRLREIQQLVEAASGEKISTGMALRIALASCQMDEQKLTKALALLNEGL